MSEPAVQTRRDGCLFSHSSAHLHYTAIHKCGWATGVWAGPLPAPSAAHTFPNGQPQLGCFPGRQGCVWGRSCSHPRLVAGSLARASAARCDASSCPTLCRRKPQAELQELPSSCSPFPSPVTGRRHPAPARRAAPAALSWPWPWTAPGGFLEWLAAGRETGPQFAGVPLSLSPALQCLPSAPLASSCWFSGVAVAAGGADELSYWVPRPAPYVSLLWAP